jgi:hypothetical protein
MVSHDMCSSITYLTSRLLTSCHVVSLARPVISTPHSPIALQYKDANKQAVQHLVTVQQCCPVDC